MATVADILRNKGDYVATIEPDLTVFDAARQMNAQHIGALAVVRGEELIGVFSERDVLTRVVAQHLDPTTTRVEEVMSRPVITCGPETPLDECKATMSSERVRHLPVVVDGRLGGIVTSGDIAAREAAESAEQVRQLNDYISGAYG